jgi:hypothetical protein
MKRFTTGLIFGAAGYAIAWSAGASPLWSVVVGLAAAALAAALV